MFYLLRICFFLIVVQSFPWLAPLHAIASSTAENVLLDKYRAIESQLVQNHFGMPLSIESTEGKDFLHVEVYSIIDHPFATVQSALGTPAHWCDIVPLHTSIGVCTYAKADDAPLLIFYAGKKAVSRPDKAHQLKYRYHIRSNRPGYFSLLLAADEGPLDTRDHRIELEAMPLSDGKTFLHFSCSYRHGRLVKVAMKGYFATAGRHKIGFSPVGTDKQGNPVYVRGVKGAVERNAMRSYLAIVSYMDTLELSGEQRLEQRLNRWYDLTERYREQLHEVEKSEYIAGKKQGYRTQLRLQSRLSS
ncbi:MAG: hypothetical protein ACOYW7_12500 [Nitrospirota bacterium]